MGAGQILARSREPGEVKIKSHRRCGGPAWQAGREVWQAGLAWCDGMRGEARPGEAMRCDAMRGAEP